MNYRKALLLPLLLLASLLVGSFPVSANPTGAPLVTFPVTPCRVFDTRVSLGAIPANTTVDLFVRGSALPASYGAKMADCGVPPSAEAAILNVAAINPTGAGTLIVDFPIAVNTSSTRLNYNVGQVNSNEMVVSLCNANVYPLATHIPCPYNQAGTLYLDAQVHNKGNTAVHVLADVVGYLAAQQ